MRDIGWSIILFWADCLYGETPSRASDYCDDTSETSSSESKDFRFALVFVRWALLLSTVIFCSYCCWYS